MVDFFIQTFNTLLYKPLFNTLVLFYQYLPGRDFGIAVIVLTVLIKFLFYPLGTKAIRSQKALSELQPKIKEIQQKNKDNKEKQAREMMEIYKKEKINPLSGCLPLLIQLPVLIALYQVFWKGFNPERMTFLYSFVPNPGLIDPFFLGLLDLSKASLIVAFLAGIFQFFQTKMTIPKMKLGQKKKSDFSSKMQKQMVYFLPIITVFILLRLPSAIGIYWITTTVFSIIQQYFIFHRQPVLIKNNGKQQN